MGIDIIAFIIGILLGIFLYWHESNGNGAYRFLNKVMNSKELQMSSDNPKGFIYKQSFIPRVLFVIFLVLITALIVEFLTPLAVFSSYNGISAFASFATGTLIGTYLANLVIKTTQVVESKSDSIGDIVEEAVEKGKDFIEDLKTKNNKAIEDIDATLSTENEPKVDKKSARDRLKDKGLI